PARCPQHPNTFTSVAGQSCSNCTRERERSMMIPLSFPSFVLLRPRVFLNKSHTIKLVLSLLIYI
ncbi:hypothetical protein M378DRAFT_169535, partial [Amanita muscaria Koide BX008]